MDGVRKCLELSSLAEISVGALGGSRATESASEGAG